MQEHPPTEGNDTVNVQVLTGDCSIDCLEACAYPGQFSECSPPADERTDA